MKKNYILNALYFHCHNFLGRKIEGVGHHITLVSTLGFYRKIRNKNPIKYNKNKSKNKDKNNDNNNNNDKKIMLCWCNDEKEK